MPFLWIFQPLVKHHFSSVNVSFVVVPAHLTGLHVMMHVVVRDVIEICYDLVIEICYDFVILLAYHVPCMQLFSSSHGTELCFMIYWHRIKEFVDNIN